MISCVVFYDTTMFGILDGAMRREFAFRSDLRCSDLRCSNLSLFRSKKFARSNLQTFSSDK